MDGAVASERSVAWSRQNILAYGSQFNDNVCVTLAAEAGQGLRGRVLARLVPPARVMSMTPSGHPPSVLGAPTLVSFSPCGHTLLAYFPAIPSMSNDKDTSTTMPPSLAMLSSASTSMPAPAGHPIPVAATSASTPTLTSSSLPTFTPVQGPTPNGTASPSITPLPGTPGSTSQGESFSLHATSPPVSNHQGVLCIWTRAEHAPVDQWSLGQWFPVQPVSDDLVAPATTTSMLLDDVLDIAWIGEPRRWKDKEGTYTRLPACGPSVLMPQPSWPLEAIQTEQACVLVTRAGQVAFLHRFGVGLSSSFLPSFRMHTAWLDQPSIQPPPPTLDHVAEHSPSRTTLLDVRHVSMTLVPSEPVILVAYMVNPRSVTTPCLHWTELHCQLDGEMSFYAIEPCPSVPLDVASMDGVASLLPPLQTACPPLTLTWTCTEANTLELWASLLVFASWPDVVQAHRPMSGSVLLAWDVRRQAESRTDLLAASFTRTPSASAIQEEEEEATLRPWKMVLRKASWVAGHVVTTLLSPSSTLPIAQTSWATAWDCQAPGLEVWGTVDPVSLTWTRQANVPPLSPSTRHRSAMALSPNGVLAAMMTWPAGDMACMALPLLAPTTDPRTSGRLLALSALRGTSATDVAHVVRMHTSPWTCASLIALMQGVSEALAFSTPQRPIPTLAQVVHMLPMVLALTSDAHDAPMVRVFERTHRLAALAHVHRVLSAARTDCTNARFVHLLLTSSSAQRVSFAPSKVWQLLHALQLTLFWLQQCVCVGWQCGIPGAESRHIPSDPLLEVLVLPAAAHLCHEVLAGLCLVVDWLASVTPAAWLEAIDQEREPSQTITVDAAQCEAALQQLVSVREYAAQLVRASPVHVRHAVDLFTPRVFELTPEAFWEAWLGERPWHTSDAAFRVAQRLQEYPAAVRDPVTLCLHAHPPWTAWTLQASLSL
ncbi:hypothetical protein Malapachy_0950 [Malassezia pachydermatis]|uniref:Uncharacterized protein n=1 Tax=Malassezia pachydermatis TaxID=77020 RepID=A0A0M8MWH7_9BASI|nr:hypothetical protein Malapachy_0950 [Malassezia pachydermatis]KOS14961.1 hypothetical protein Malapachy_0950 [Malassezia pachydermatis]